MFELTILSTFDVDRESVGDGESIPCEQTVGRIEPIGSVVGMLACRTRDAQNERQRFGRFDGDTDNVFIGAARRLDAHWLAVELIVRLDNTCQQVEPLVDVSDLRLFPFVDEKAQIAQMQTVRIGAKPVGRSCLAGILLRIDLLRIESLLAARTEVVGHKHFLRVVLLGIGKTVPSPA